MKRILAMLVVCLLAVSIFTGCNTKAAVDKNVKPEEHFSQYKVLTDLYGTPWRDVLTQLKIDKQELKTDGLNYVGIPLQDTYADITFDVFLRFRGEDNHLTGVEYAAEYSYPENEEQLLRDLVRINRKLIADFGDPSNTSPVFNWVEKYMGEKWNRAIPYWQDMQVLKRLLDNDYMGSLLLWNLETVASEETLKYDVDHSLAVMVAIDAENGTASIILSY